MAKENLEKALCKQDNDCDQSDTDEDQDGSEKSGRSSSPIPPEVLEKLPPEDRKEIKRIFSSMMIRGYMGPAEHPLTQKLTADHITKIIDYTEKEDQRIYQNTKEERKAGLTIFFGILFPIVGLMVFFTLFNKTDILIPMVSAIVGFGGGYGFGKSR